MAVQFAPNTGARAAPSLGVSESISAPRRCNCLNAAASWSQSAGLERLLTCEEDTLMTTLSTFVGRQPNAVLDRILGEEAMSHCRDLFEHVHGPRIRDLVSHGACNSNELPAALCNSLALLWHRLVARCALHHQERARTLPVHVPVFHPSSILFARLQRFGALLGELALLENALPAPTSDFGNQDNAARALAQRWAAMNGGAAFASVPIVDSGPVEVLQRLCEQALDAALLVAVALVRPLKHRHPHPDGQCCVVHVLDAALAGIRHSALCGAPAATDWLTMLWRALGMLQPRVAAGKWKAVGAQLSVWLRVPAAAAHQGMVGSISYRERAILSSGLDSLEGRF
jgi:hypothetical protein